MLFIATATAFLLAGLCKGVVGLGLPAVSIGLLALVMPPTQAAAILILPSLVTNVWQTMDGPSPLALARRLAPMLLGVVAGVGAGSGWLTSVDPKTATGGLGLTILVYGAISLARWQVRLGARQEVWAGPLAGVATGLVTSATGVFMIPMVPYLQAIGLEKDELVQALGLSFLVSTMALAFNLAAAGVLTWHVAPLSVVALLAAAAGMWAGGRLRGLIDAVAFRRIFLFALMALGLSLTLRGFA